MSEVRYSNLAQSDLLEIAEYTLNSWGVMQADLYLAQIEDCCQKLAHSPGIGRFWTPRRPGIRRFEEGRHVIFYRQTDDGVLIVRILHQTMDPSRQPFEQA